MDNNGLSLILKDMLVKTKYVKLKMECEFLKK